MALQKSFTPINSRELLEALECGRESCPCHQSARNGRGLTHCPAHTDLSPSFSVKPGQDGGAVWHCFGGCPKEETTSALRERGVLGRGAATSGPAPLPIRQAFSPKAAEVVPSRQAALLGWAMDEYRKLLPGSPAMRYMRKRGLPEPGCGWAPGGRFLLGRVGLGGEKVTLAELADAGLVHADGAWAGADVMRGRVVMPFSWQGRTSALCGRAVDADSPPHRRYLYTKSERRWPLGLFNEAALSAECLAVTEGALDAIALTYLCGAPAVALGGLQHPRSIDRLAALPSTTKVLLAFDADEAGDKGRTRIGEALAKGPQVKHVRPGPDVKDWPDIVQARADLQRRHERVPAFRLAAYEVRAPPLAAGAPVGPSQPPTPSGDHQGTPLPGRDRKPKNTVATMSLTVRYG